MPSRNIRASLLACYIAQTGRQAIKRAGEPVHVWRSLHPLLRADGRQKLFEARHRDAQLTLQPPVTIERQGATADCKNFALMQPCLRDVDATACSLHLAKSYRPGLG